MRKRYKRERKPTANKNVWQGHAEFFIVMELWVWNAFSNGQWDGVVTGMPTIRPWNIRILWRMFNQSGYPGGLNSHDPDAVSQNCLSGGKHYKRYDKNTKYTNTRSKSSKYVHTYSTGNGIGWFVVTSATHRGDNLK